MNIIYTKHDLTEQQANTLIAGGEIAVDTELTGLDVQTDALCLVQLRGAGSDDFFLVHIKDECEYPNLARVLTAKRALKIFHYARMDMCMIYKRLGVWVAPVFCTKIGILLARPKKGHTLQNALREIFKIEIDKEECCSDWTKTLSARQQKYAATDVLYLHELKRVLFDALRDKNRLDLAEKCFDFLPMRCALDLDWGTRDIFGYNPK